MLVGHVTKDGGLAGPRTLEHIVDTVLSFDGDRHQSLRLLSASKHRYGPTGELGMFEMTETGLRGLADPSALLLGDRRRGVPGSIAVPVLEGRRPLIVEVQGLVGPPSSASRGELRKECRAAGSPCCSPCWNGGATWPSPRRTCSCPPWAVFV